MSCYLIFCNLNDSVDFYLKDCLYMSQFCQTVKSLLQLLLLIINGIWEMVYVV